MLTKALTWGSPGNKNNKKTEAKYINAITATATIVMANLREAMWFIFFRVLRVGATGVFVGATPDLKYQVIFLNKFPNECSILLENKCYKKTRTKANNKSG
jgi:hypothetical protein